MVPRDWLVCLDGCNRSQLGFVFLRKVYPRYFFKLDKFATPIEYCWYPGGLCKAPSGDNDDSTGKNHAY